MCIVTLDGVVMGDAMNSRAKVSLMVSIRAVEWSVREREQI